MTRPLRTTFRAAAILSLGLIASITPVTAKNYAPWVLAVSAESISGTSADLNTTSNDGCPIESPDGLHLYTATNRLRRKFDPTSKYMETKAQMDNVMDDGRKINQIMVRGKYGTQAERYWGVLRSAVKDLARCYNLTPLAV